MNVNKTQNKVVLTVINGYKFILLNYWCYAETQSETFAAPSHVVLDNIHQESNTSLAQQFKH